MLISVVMPVYNGERFLREAVGSVLNQTHRDLELVAVDDGSTDNTPAILEEFAAADPRVRVIRQANGGGARARNRALKAARADWVVNLDQDDVMLPERVARQVAFVATHREVRAFACRARYINAAGRVFGLTKSEPLLTRAQFERYVAAGEPIGINHSCVMMHRPTVLAVGGYRPQWEGAEDIDLWNRLAEHGHLVLQQDEVLMSYRVHDASVMASRTRQCWEVGDWAVACMQARRAGLVEPTREEFERQLRSLPWWRRVLREREMLARVHYRVAGLEIGCGQWPRGIVRLLLTGCIMPGYVLGRLSAQLPGPWQRVSVGHPAMVSLTVTGTTAQPLLGL